MLAAIYAITFALSFLAVSSVVDQSSSSNDATQSNTQTTAYLVPIMGAGPGGQGTIIIVSYEGCMFTYSHTTNPRRYTSHEQIPLRY